MLFPPWFFAGDREHPLYSYYEGEYFRLMMMMNTQVVNGALSILNSHRYHES